MEQKIYSALAKFADIVKPIEKDASNPFFKSKYATLSHIQEVIKPHLKASGLILVHAVTGDSVTSTVYAVEDGSSVSSAFPFILGKPQENGSAVTYAKRYNTAALLNLDTDADDDGNEAQKNETASVAKTATALAKPVELPWMNDNQLADLLSLIDKGQYDGKNGQEVTKIARQKYAVNRDMAAKIDKAVSIRVGNVPKKDLTKEAGSIFKDPKVKAGGHIVDGIAVADIPF
jgi:hypothetical protein